MTITFSIRFNPNINPIEKGIIKCKTCGSPFTIKCSMQQYKKIGNHNIITLQYYEEKKGNHEFGYDEEIAKKYLDKDITHSCNGEIGHTDMIKRGIITYKCNNHQ